MSNKTSGFALPVTLIILAVLTVLSMGLSQMARNQLQDIQLRQDLWHLERNAQDLVHEQVYSLLVGDYGVNNVSVDGETIPLDGRQINTGDVLFQIQDISGLYGLAFMDQRIVKRIVELFTDQDTALNISMELSDWVDPDQRQQFKGLEAADYRNKGLPQLPRNAPIRSIDELQELPSMTRQILYGSAQQEGLKDWVVAGGESRFNVAVAPDKLIGAVLGLTADEASEIIAARKSGNWSRVNQLVDEGNWVFNGAPPLSHGTRYRFTITNNPEVVDNHSVVVSVQVKLTPFDAAGPFKLIEWLAPDYTKTIRDL